MNGGIESNFKRNRIREKINWLYFLRGFQIISRFINIKVKKKKIINIIKPSARYLKKKKKMKIDYFDVFQKITKYIYIFITRRILKLILDHFHTILPPVSKYRLF